METNSMKIERHAFHFYNVEKGTAVTLYHDKAVVKSLDEANSWDELRQAAARQQTDEDGKVQNTWRAMIADDSPFNGRFVIPLKSKEGGKSFAIFSRHAFDVMCEKHFGNGSATVLALWPIDSSPVADSGAYAVISGEMNGIPCINIVSKDRQRAIIVASRKSRVLDSVLDRILGQVRTRSGVDMHSKDSVDGWELLRERMELITITVRTVDQAFNALGKYWTFVEDSTGKEKSANGRQS
jgi:hypothetical protein